MNYHDALFARDWAKLAELLAARLGEPITAEIVAAALDGIEPPDGYLGHPDTRYVWTDETYFSWIRLRLVAAGIFAASVGAAPPRDIISGIELHTGMLWDHPAAATWSPELTWSSHTARSQIFQDSSLKPTPIDTTAALVAPPSGKKPDRQGRRRGNLSPTGLSRTYRAPRCKPGHTIACLLRGDVEIDGLTEGSRSTAEGTPLAWPYIEPCPGTGRRTLLLCGDLVAAVRTEAARDVAQAWGVSRWQVGRWRRALAVGRMTAGTRQLWRDLAAQRLTPASRRKGGLAAHARSRKESP